MKLKHRGFEIVTAYLGKDIHLPKRNTEHSAGYDFESAIDVLIQPGQTVAVPTGVKAYMEEGEVLQIFPRSSLSYKRHLTLPNSVGIIDKDYYNNPDNEGHIHILLWNFGSEPAEIKQGERLAQGIFTKFLTVDDEPSSGAKLLGGFGSTGR
ncbi:MAG: dUTP diphosphatase [Candidatus Izemoplasmatales bacterium]|nr:dUTP diphosphatase [Candidatus Izemoplasmatales bacterium]